MHDEFLQNITLYYKKWQKSDEILQSIDNMFHLIKINNFSAKIFVIRSTKAKVTKNLSNITKIPIWGLIGSTFIMTDHSARYFLIKSLLGVANKLCKKGFSFGLEHFIVTGTKEKCTSSFWQPSRPAKRKICNFKRVICISTDWWEIKTYLVFHI